MFHWEPEGRYYHRLCISIAPFWFSTDWTEHLWKLDNALLALNWRYEKILWLYTNHDLCITILFYSFAWLIIQFVPKPFSHYVFDVPPKTNPWRAIFSEHNETSFHIHDPHFSLYKFSGVVWGWIVWLDFTTTKKKKKKKDVSPWKSSEHFM